MRLSWTVVKSGRMDESKAIEALSALAQPTRLRVFRELAALHPDGLASGEIARRCGVPHNTMSVHLAVLTRAGLALGERSSRSITYTADLHGLQALVGFLLRDCCGGRPEVCLPVVRSITPVSACETEPADA